MFIIIKQLFDNHVKLARLKRIDREVNKYHRLKTKEEIQCKIINSLIKKYNETYAGDFGGAIKWNG